MSNAHTTEGWVGFDLDATLAYHVSGGHFDPLEIGRPVPMMLKTLKQHLKQGDSCYVVTARVSHPEDTPEQVEAIKQAIRDWTEEHCGQPLECRNKDYQMLYTYDDRVRQVIPNTGITMGQLVAMLRHELERLEAGMEFAPEVEDKLEEEAGA